MPGGMTFRRTRFDFNPGNKDVQINDLRDDDEVRALIVDIIGSEDIEVEIAEVVGLQDALDQIVADMEAALNAIGDVVWFLDTDNVPYFSASGPNAIITMLDTDGVVYWPALLP